MFQNKAKLTAGVDRHPGAAPVHVGELIVWLVSIIATPLVLAEWASVSFVVTWSVVHSIAYWLFAVGPLGWSGTPWRVLRMATSIVVWGSVSVSALVAGDFVQHEPLVLLVATAFISLRAIVTLDDTRRAWEVDGVVIGAIAATCSFVGGRPALGVATMCGAFVYLLVERGQLALHEEVRADRHKLSSAMASMTELAFSDQLTGLANRRAAVDWLGAHTTGAGGAVLFDIDEFKVINDRYGHGVGDDVLTSAATVLSERLGDRWQLFRLGGDEFIGFTGTVDGPLPVCAESFSVAADSYDGTPVKIDVAVSGGVSVVEFPATLDGVMGLLAPALRSAKRDKGSGIVTSTSEMAAEDPWVFSMRVLDALDAEQFTWWGQPIIDVATGAPVAVELLCRWPGDGGIISEPRDFLGTLSTFQRLGDLGRLNLQAIAAWLRALDAADFDDLTVHWNVPPSHVAGGLVADLEATLDRSQWSRIAIEVLESEVLDINTTVIEAVDELRAAGVTVLIDDFGAGHSSFRHLSELAFDGVKLDQVLVHGADTHARRAAIIEGIAPVFASMDIVTVAEGVESAGELATVRAACVDQAQGWHIARPEPLDQCLRTLRRLQENVIDLR